MMEKTVDIIFYVDGKLPSRQCLTDNPLVHLVFWSLARHLNTAKNFRACGPSDIDSG